MYTFLLFDEKGNLLSSSKLELKRTKFNHLLLMKTLEVYSQKLLEQELEAKTVLVLDKEFNSLLQSERISYLCSA